MYAEKFVRNLIEFDMLAYLNVGLLEEMGITIISDVSSVLRHIKQVSLRRCNNFIRDFFSPTSSTLIHLCVTDWREEECKPRECSGSLK